MEVYRNHIRRLAELKEEPHYPFDSEHDFQMPSVNEEVTNLRNELDEVKEALRNTPQPIIEECKQSIISALRRLIEKVNGNIDNLPLSKNQSLVIRGAVYSKFIRHLNESLKYLGAWYISSFYYSIDPQDQLDSEPVLGFFNRWITTLQDEDYNSYFELDADFEKMIQELKDLWKADTGIGRI